MAVLTTCRPGDEAVTSAVLHLTRTQTADAGGSWTDETYYYFPLMALGRYVESVQRSELCPFFSFHLETVHLEPSSIRIHNSV